LHILQIGFAPKRVEANASKEREADGRIYSFLDKNELELKDGSVPKAALE